MTNVIIPKLSHDDIDFLLGDSSCHQDLVAEYIRFMTMIKMRIDTDPIVPSKAVDSVWRVHIGNTQLYAAFCKKYFSNFSNEGFIDRIPSLITHDNYVATLTKLATVFVGTAIGSPVIKYWPVDDYVEKTDKPRSLDKKGDKMTTQETKKLMFNGCRPLSQAY